MVLWDIKMADSNFCQTVDLIVYEFYFLKFFINFLFYVCFCVDSLVSAHMVRRQLVGVNWQNNPTISLIIFTTCLSNLCLLGWLRNVSEITDLTKHHCSYKNHRHYDQQASCPVRSGILSRGNHTVPNTAGTRQWQAGGSEGHSGNDPSGASPLQDIPRKLCCPLDCIPSLTWPPAPCRLYAGIIGLGAFVGNTINWSTLLASYFLLSFSFWNSRTVLLEFERKAPEDRQASSRQEWAMRLGVRVRWQSRQVQQWSLWAAAWEEELLREGGAHAQISVMHRKWAGLAVRVSK